jgi:hypothetical protein
LCWILTCTESSLLFIWVILLRKDMLSVHELVFHSSCFFISESLFPCNQSIWIMVSLLILAENYDVSSSRNTVISLIPYLDANTWKKRWP